MSALPALHLEARRSRWREPRPLPKGLDAMLARARNLFPTGAQRRASLARFAEKVTHLRKAAASSGSRAFSERLAEMRMRLRRRDGGEPLHEAFALVAEAAARRLHLEPHPEQIMGAAALERGWLAEMATGEGKTLTLALAAAVAGWRAWPCHLVTANDYLAERDAAHLRDFFRDCGLSCAAVTTALDPAARRAAYGADLVYTTSKELLADFLRDRIALGSVAEGSRRNLRQWIAGATPIPTQTVLRGLHTAFIDEADNQLIDEAVTPLILSASGENDVLIEACHLAAELAARLEEGADYKANHRTGEITLEDSAHDLLRAEAARAPDIFRGAHWLADLVQQSLRARTFFHRGKQYIVEEGKVVIVDEFTGRLMPNRTWRHGLHQAVETLERLEVTAPTDTLAQMSFQRFFRHFERLAGLTGTASEAASEFALVYGVPVVAIPTHRLCQRRQWPDRHFATAEEKWDAVVESIASVHASGRPILAGTRSIAASEELARRLAAKGLTPAVLNATKHREEASIIAGAGQPGCITIATNMAGRGTDILLGRGIAAQGGLHVIATERHESGRIDRQLFGRAGRQGDPGSAQAFISIEDELPRRFLTKAERAALSGLLRLATPGADLLCHAAIRRAQAAAQRMAFRQRRSVIDADAWADDALSFAGR
jgi:preprotein translocase subunit SecA